MFVGGNLEQLTVLASTFAGEAEQVERLNRAIDAGLAQTEWTGRASDEFRRRWHEEFQPTLAGLQNALLDASRVVSVRRDALDQATNLMGG